jgi:hypothetical protein
MELADPSELSFVKFPALDDVVERYPLVCREIEEEATNFLFDKVRTSYLASGGEAADLVLRIGTTNAIGTFDVFVLNGSRFDRPDRPIVEKVGGFGPIRYVAIECSRSLRQHTLPHIETFVRSLESFQRLFEQKFIELHERSRDRLVSGIEPLLLSVCGDDEAKVIKRNCRISVTLSQNGRFRFHISGNQIGELTHLLSSKKFEFEPDPVLAMKSFLYCDETDFFYDKFRGGRSGFLRAKFSQTESVSVNLPLQHIEKVINDSSEVSCIEVAEVSGFSIQVSTNPKHENVIRAILSRCLQPLTNQFTTNVSNHIADRHAIGEKVRRMYVLHLSRLERLFDEATMKATVEHALGKVLDVFKPG